MEMLLKLLPDQELLIVMSFNLTLSAQRSMELSRGGASSGNFMEFRDKLPRNNCVLKLFLLRFYFIFKRSTGNHFNDFKLLM